MLSNTRLTDNIGISIQVMWKAVYHSMKGNLQRRYTMQRLHIYPDAKVPDDIMGNITNQLRTPRPVPKRLDAYSEGEVTSFPKVVDLPKDYVLR
jgi:large subunit ribosomal protein L13